LNFVAGRGDRPRPSEPAGAIKSRCQAWQSFAAISLIALPD